MNGVNAQVDIVEVKIWNSMDAVFPLLEFQKTVAYLI